MKLIELNLSQYGIDLSSYFGEIYIATQTIVLLVVAVIVLRAAKLWRNRK